MDLELAHARRAEGRRAPRRSRRASSASRSRRTGAGSTTGPRCTRNGEACDLERVPAEAARPGAKPELVAQGVKSFEFDPRDPRRLLLAWQRDGPGRARPRRCGRTGKLTRSTAALLPGSARVPRAGLARLVYAVVAAEEGGGVRGGGAAVGRRRRSPPRLAPRTRARRPPAVPSRDAARSPRPAREVQRFAAHLEAERRASAHTRKAYLGDLAQFAAYARRAGAPLVPSSPALVRGWLARARRTRGRRASGASSPRSASLYRFLVREGLAPANPARAVSGPKRPKRLPTVLPEEEVAALVEASRGDADPASRAARASATAPSSSCSTRAGCACRS